MDQIWACQCEGPCDHAQAGLEVHQLEHACDEEQDVDAVEGVVPVEHVDQVIQGPEVMPRTAQPLAVAVQLEEVGCGLQVGVHLRHRTCGPCRLCTAWSARG
jgi:hypothetical protein